MELRDVDVHVRVIDQRIGMGVGGLNTVIRLYHIPTGVLVEIPSGTAGRSQYYDRQLGMDMIAFAIANVFDDKEAGDD